MLSDVYFKERMSQNMKKIISLILIISLLAASSLTFATNKVTDLPISNVSIELISDQSYYVNGQLQGTVKYLVDGILYEYSIQSTDMESIVIVNSENQEKSIKVVYTYDDQLIKADNEIIGKVNSADGESIFTTNALGSGTTWDTKPFYGSPSDYNILTYDKRGSVRFSEKIITMITSGSTGLASGYIIASVISSTGIGIVAGSLVAAIIAGLTYNPQDAAYFHKLVYKMNIPGYYKYIAHFYYDPSHSSYWGTNIAYSTSW